jgi:hypothetical protein
MMMQMKMNHAKAAFIAVLHFIGTVACSAIGIIYAKIQFETAPSLWMNDSLFSLLSISATFEHVCRFDATVCMQFIICFVPSNSRWLKLFKFNSDHEHNIQLLFVFYNIFHGPKLAYTTTWANGSLDLFI